MQCLPKKLAARFALWEVVKFQSPWPLWAVWLATFAVAALAIPTSAAPTPTSPEATSPLKNGLPLPKIALRDSAGNLYELSKSLKNGSAILIFYRGGWCPYCNAQLAELSVIEPDLLKLGYRIFAISPDSPTELAKTSDKYKLKYKLLSDSKMNAARAVGLAFQVEKSTIEKYRGYGIDLEKSSGEKHGLLPVPAVYLIGSDGVVDFSYVNPDYRTRLPGELVLAAARVFARKTPSTPAG